MGQSPAGTTCNTDGIGIPLLNGPTEFGSHHPSAIQFTTDAKRYAKPGDILFCVRGSTTGRMNWADRVYAIGRGIGAIRHKQGVEYQPLVRGVIECELSDLLTQATGSTFPNVSASQLSKIRWPALEDAEQRRIAHILGTLDDKIENNRKTAKTLEAMAQAIFKSWFVDFDPVRAKMAGESRESICKRLKLTPEILDLFPDRLVDSELGEIPEGWGVGMLDNLAALVTDSTSPGRSPHTVFEHYSIPAFDAGRTPAMELGESIKSNKYVVKDRAVLVSKLNPHTPRIWLPANGDGAAICSTEFMQFVPHEREDRPYLYCLMISQSMQEEVLKHVTGSTGSRQRAQPSQIAKVKILSPQSCVKKVFTHQASPLLHAVAENLTASRTLAALRDALLPRLISGEIRVADTHGCSKEILV